MLKNIKKVTIVGGGSAGWMSACMFIKTFPHWDIQIIESPDYPIVGVGESTLLGIREFLHYLDISLEEQKDMMRYTDASYKMSIKFTDFYDKDSGGYHYPFGEPYVEESKEGLQDWMIRKSLDDSIPVQDFVKTYYPSAALFENNKYCDNKYGILPGYEPHRHCAYHFDATKLGQWLKNNYCLPRGVELISNTVEDILTNDDGIEALILKTGEKVVYDLYVDCTGFKSLLLDKTLQSEFTSFTDLLPNNRAWAVHLPYKDKEKELEGFTNSTAIGHGWCWNIPLWSRIGTGYVYSDKHITPQDAKEEFKEYLMSDKVVIPRSREDVENLNFKDIQMRVGMHKQSFYKNVVAIGLSAGFIEPLESNGLLSVHIFLFKLMKTLLRESVNQFEKDSYNKETYWFFKNFAEFVALHYAFSIRNDTNYWRDITSKTFDETMYDNIKYDTISFSDISHKKHYTSVLDPKAGVTYVSIGMNYLVMDKVTMKTNEFWTLDTYKNDYQNSFIRMDINKKNWQTFAIEQHSLYKYLKDNIHVNGD